VAAEVNPQTPGVLESDLADKPQWIRNNDALVAGLVATVGAEAALTELTDRFYRNYLSTLIAVDEGVDRLMTALDASGELDDTLVVFTSDNGFHLGEHGLILRKATPYEESIRVPLLVRVPGAEAGGVVTTPVANVDVTATVLDWLDVAPGLEADGTSLLPLLDDPAAGTDRVVLLESTERGNGGAPPYVGLRTERYSYVEYGNGERELYDLQLDPSQLENLAGDFAYAATVQALEALAVELGACGGEACTTTASIPGPAGA
jgi:arylsulfatase A-like enzyme